MKINVPLTEGTAFRYLKHLVNLCFLYMLVIIEKHD